MELLDHLYEVVAKDGVSDYALELFKSLVLDYYHEHGRPFAWRQITDPYLIVVSEVMLQQTQTHRVIEKYNNWRSVFPDFKSLARAPIVDVLKCWQGLGYNRRALYLHKTANAVVDRFDGQLPDDPELLITLSGIGPNTAASICAFAFNKPVVFIETNIRAVFIHCFFHEQVNISDKQLMPLIEQTLDYDNPRQWYYALMDFGVMLKKEFKNPSRKSAHHTIQSKFDDSDRQIRGMILRLLLDKQKITEREIVHAINKKSERVSGILDCLVAESLVVKEKGQLSLPL